MSEKKKFSADGPAPRKRFWTQASVEPSDNGFAVLLDGKPVRLPGREVLQVQSRALAEALAAEWQAAGMDDPQKRFAAEDLPLTRIAGTMIERVTPDRQHSVDTLAGYGEHDLLCYRSEASDPLSARQQELWQPWLDWLHKTYDVTLTVTHGLMPVPQPSASLKKLKQVLSERSDAILAALGVCVPALGSLTLGLAVIDGRLDAERAVNIATLDERAQMERWGEDVAHLDRIATMSADVTDAARFVTLAKDK
ncbi:ATP12 family chaperone protein [Acetobacter sp. UBA5411]|uniref:ATP12 family chaperone protein n=1 Tax=Acetobacter sp. UBA5411 TaxID=1945905 RepID=UPI0025C53D18|nr:ATP12 family protein [Acetobacter sp. UBA5411]